MIGEVIESTLEKSKAHGRWQLKFKMIVDNDIAYGFCNVEEGYDSLFLLERIGEMWWAPPERFVGKLYPMRQYTYNNKTVWSLDWSQMGRMAKYWRDREKATVHNQR